MYKEIDANIVDLYNGAVEAVITLLGAITAILAGYMDNNRLNQYNTLILTLCTIVEVVLLLWASQTHSLYACYFAYISFGTIYNFMITVARYLSLILFIQRNLLLLIIFTVFFSVVVHFIAEMLQNN